MTTLVTGGAGFVGSHTCAALLATGRDVVCLDDLSNGSAVAVARAAALTGRPLPLVRADVRDRAAVARALRDHDVDAVVHFAARKAVAESVAAPAGYWSTNVGGSIALVEACLEAGVHRLVFSSSATVYGRPAHLPLDEDHPLSAVNPYGATKIATEQLLRDVCAAEPRFSAVALRYFNPIGAHPSGRLGEDPAGVPDNLFPYLLQVAVGRREALSVFGTDWPTDDGTGVRDYVHVVDLAEGHARALDHTAATPGFVAVNLGTGRGTSVLQLVAAFERATGVGVPWRPAPRREGDVAACWAAVARAERLLGWRAARDLDAMCADGWRWQQANPAGYG
ncbi:MAG: UDP-glucose 4-epimerase GalE [Myxococcota bacterium]